MNGRLKNLRYVLCMILFLLVLTPFKASAAEARWFGSQLSGSERKIYDEIVDNYTTFKEDEDFIFEDIEDTSIEQVNIAVESFLNDYPEAYWITTFWVGSEHVSPVFYSGADQDIEATDQAIQKAINYINTFPTDLEKIRAINDYICNNTTYAASVHQGQSIMGGLLKKYGNKFVCAGHCRLFQLLCIKCNIPCVYVRGDNHAFNYVKYNNKWYMVDVTFNHPQVGNVGSLTQVVTHDYLMRGTDYVSEYHQLLTPLGEGSYNLKYPELAKTTIIYLQDCTFEDISDDDSYYSGRPIEHPYEVQRVIPRTLITGNSKTGIQYFTTYETIDLEKGKDYTTTCSNNVNPGKAKVTFKGIGRCTGIATRTFDIYPQPVKAKKVSGTTQKIAAGKKVKLSTSELLNINNSRFKWTSSNKKVATVTQSGLVKTNKKAGGKTVIITAKAKDGSGNTATWKINVMKGAVKKITFKGKKNTLKAGSSMKLKVAIEATEGKSVNKKVFWSSSNPKYATVTQSGKVKASKAGKGKTVKIKATSTDGTKKSVTLKIKIN